MPHAGCTLMIEVFSTSALAPSEAPAGDAGGNAKGCALAPRGVTTLSEDRPPGKTHEPSDVFRAPSGIALANMAATGSSMATRAPPPLWGALSAEGHAGRERATTIPQLLHATSEGGLWQLVRKIPVP